MNKSDYISLANLLAVKKAQVQSIEQEIDNIPGIWAIRMAEKAQALDICENFFSDTKEADYLASVLIDRDEPMTRNEIISVFESYGHTYSMKHVNACNPDSEETVNEQIKHYK